MAKEKVLLGDDVVSREMPEYKELVGDLAEIERMADKVVGSVRPSLLNERYFSTEEVCNSSFAKNNFVNHASNWCF